MTEIHILLIEDDPMIGQSLMRALDDAGISCRWVRDGATGEAALDVHEYTLVLLDLGLPDKSGFDILQTLRDSGDLTPLLIITARDEVDDRVRGLDLGADDYLIKPFGVRELMARIHAILRRKDDPTASIISNGEINLNMATQQVSYREKTALLSAREFALLQALVERPGTILSRRQIENRIYAWNEEIASNAVDVIIHYLRKKFDNEIIRNVRGIGWMVVKQFS